MTLSVFVKSIKTKTKYSEQLTEIVSLSTGIIWCGNDERSIQETNPIKRGLRRTRSAAFNGAVPNQIAEPARKCRE